MSDFSKYKVMELPRNVVVGHGVIPSIPDNCTRLALPRTALIVADEITKKIAGLEIETALKDAGYNVEMICIKEADADTVTAIQGQAEELAPHSLPESVADVPSTSPNAPLSMPECRSSACQPRHPMTG
jgi:glycerol dehydrogenase-like iron-containing ADH family enzyme